MIRYLFDIFFAYVLGDFLIGVFHWFKDTYFNPNTPIIGRRIIWPSRLHHIKPRFVTEFSNWDLFKSSALWSMIWIGPLILFNGLNLFIFTLFMTIGLNDIIHKYAHMLDSERPQIVTILQKWNIIQGFDEHHQHHISPHEVNYFPITPFLNKIFEHIGFWRKLENIIQMISGVKPRDFKDEYIADSSYPAGIKFVSN